MQQIDFSGSKAKLEQIAAEPESQQTHILYEVIWILIIAIERMQKELAK